MLTTLKKSIFYFSTIAVLLALAGCSTAAVPNQTPAQINANSIHNPVPKNLPLVADANHTYKINGKTYHVLKSPYGYHAIGTASWYGTDFQGHRTSTGERYNMLNMTAASKVLPLPCFARVTNIKTHKSIIVKVNDRGPFEKNRLIDLSYAAALKLGLAGRGVGLVSVDTIDPAHPDSYLHLPKDQEKLTNCLDKGQIYYIIHIATYNTSHDANHIASKLKASGIKAEVMHYNEFYLVQAKATSQTEVSTIKTKLSHVGFSDVIIKKEKQASTKIKPTQGQQHV